MSLTEFRYKAFISYSHADKAWAEWLLKSLESYRVPSNLVGRRTDFGLIPARLAPIFRDRDELPAAHRLTDRLFEALRASEFLIVLCSPRAAKSKLVNREIIEFKKTHGDGRVLCMILDGVPFADDPAEECFPEALLHSFTSDGRRGGLSAEGLAADFRDEGDGKQMGLLKVVAGMIGVGLNDLVRRDQQRRQRTMIAVAAASVIGMSVMGTLTYEASKARETASVARDLALLRQQEAQDQLKHNEELLHYMMTTMYERLLEHGNLEALDTVNQQVLASFENRDLSTISPSQLFHYTGTLLRFGQNLDRKGRSEEARKVFDEVMKISRRFKEEHPRSAEANFRLQNNLFFTGYLALRQGRFEDAERDYRERLEINEWIHTDTGSLNPFHELAFGRPALWTEKLADSKMSLARLLGGPLGQVEEAIPLHIDSIALYKEAVDAQPDSKELKIDLGSAYHYAGHTYLKAGDLDAAQGAFEARMAIFDDLTALEPDNFRTFRRMMISKQNLAKVAAARGELTKAFDLYAEAADGFDRLVIKDPVNTLWLANSAQSYYMLAHAAMQLNLLDEARQAHEIAKVQITEALARDNTRTLRKLTRYLVDTLEAELMMADGREDAALMHMASLTASLDAEAESYLQSDGALEHFADAKLFYGQLLANKGDMDSAKAQWASLVGMVQKSKATVALDTKNSLAAALHLLGRDREAETLFAELEGYGYQAQDSQFSRITTLDSR